MGSLGNAMGMLLLGAKGNTEKQITNKLFGAKQAEEVSASYKKLDSVLKAIIKSNTVQVNSVNRIYLDKTYNLLKGYLTSVKKYYASKPISVDFKHDPEKSRQEINTLGAEKTGNMNETTRAVLVNALYFKGSWETPFIAKSTKRKPFHVSAKKKVKTPMMTMESKFHFMVLDKTANVIPNATRDVNFKMPKGSAAALRMPF